MGESEQAMAQFVLCPKCGRAAHREGEVIRCAACGSFSAQVASSPPIQAPPSVLGDAFHPPAVECPHCRCNVAFVAELAGTTVVCSTCRREFVMNSRRSTGNPQVSLTPPASHQFAG